jgi:hypothetical protein
VKLFVRFISREGSVVWEHTHTLATLNGFVRLQTATKFLSPFDSVYGLRIFGSWRWAAAGQEGYRWAHV